MEMIQRCLFVLTVFRGVESLVHSTYEGCFKDSYDDRKLNGYNITLPNMTSQICNFICFQKGFIFAGIQNRIECYCGDYDHPTYPTPIDDYYCTQRDLVAEADIRVGTEPLTLAVHRTGIEYATSLEKKFVGCVSDEGSDVLIPHHKMELSRTNSPKICVAACSSLGFKHAGLSQSTLCYCGAARRIVERTGCDAPCPKSTTNTCGGYLKISLYNTATDPDILPPRVSELGCFKNKPGGLLTEFRQVSANMTPTYCIATCLKKGYLIAGLSNGNECECGSDVPYPAPDKVPDEYCSSKCSGNSEETCGSSQHVQGYSTSIVGRHPLYGKWLGCYREHEEIVREKIIKLDNNNPIDCVSQCLKHGYALAAIGTLICRCGNVLIPKLASLMLSSSSCNSSCQDGSMTCGGLEALDVYRTGLDYKAQDGCVKSVTEVKGEQVCSGKIIFNEDFNKLDLNTWQRTVQISGQDHEFVTYSYDKANSFVKDGNLHIRPSLLTDDFVRNGQLTLDGCTGSTQDDCSRSAVSFRILPPVRSAQLTTKNFFTFKYGVINIRAKLPRGDWIYPQIWLKPAVDVYGPDYWSGKLVLVSSSGNSNLTSSSGQDIGISRVESAVLLGQAPDNFRYKYIYFRGQPWSDQFHNYTVIWSPDSIVMYVDNQYNDRKTLVEMNERKSLSADVGFSSRESEIWRDGSKSAPFDQQFYLTVGLGVGGHTMFPDNSRSGGRNKPWNNYQVKAMMNFWQARGHWQPTWSQQSDLIVDSISVQAL